MKKWLVVVLVAGLSIAAGCDKEAKKADEQPAQEHAAAASADEEAAQQEEAAQKAERDEEHEQAEKNAELPADLEAGKSGTYGGEFTIDGEPMTLAAAIAQAGEAEGVYKISGSIEKVCKKKGCWFTLAGEGVDEPVRVRMQDYSFFVPRNADGGQAVVEGKLEKRVIPQEEAQHYADDEAAGTGKEPQKIEGDQVQWEMTITAAQITKS